MHSAHLRLIISSKLVCVLFVQQTVQRYHHFEYVPIWQIQLLIENKIIILFLNNLRNYFKLCANFILI